MKKQALITLIKKDNQVKETVIIEIKEEKLNYIEKSNTEVLFDVKKQLLIRDNKELYMEFDFKNNKANIYIKDLKANTELLLKTEKINITNNKIVIQYTMENEDYLYQIEMED